MLAAGLFFAPGCTDIKSRPQPVVEAPGPTATKPTYQFGPNHSHAAWKCHVSRRLSKSSRDRKFWKCSHAYLSIHRGEKPNATVVHPQIHWESARGNVELRKATATPYSADALADWASHVVTAAARESERMVGKVADPQNSQQRHAGSSIGLPSQLSARPFAARFGSPLNNNC